MDNMTMNKRTGSSNSLQAGEILTMEFETVKDPLPTDILCGECYGNGMAP